MINTSLDIWSMYLTQDTPPPPESFIVTENDDQIITENDDNLTTG